MINGSVKEYLRNSTFIKAGLLLIFGLVILWGSKYVSNHPELYIIVVTVGASFIAGCFLSLLSSSIVMGVGELIDKKIISKIHVLSEAKTCGIEHIFKRRRKDENYNEELIKQLEGMEKGKEVLMMSNSLRDFFGPRCKDEYLSAIFKMLKNDVKFRILLLDPTSERAQDRAWIEEGIEKNSYTDSALFTGIKSVAKWLNEPPSKDIKERVEKQIKVRFFPYDPTTHIIRTDKFTFIEQYHRGGNEIIEKELEKEGFPDIDCFGGFVPVLMVKNSAFFAELMKSHFDNIWNSEEVKKRDLRETNYYQTIVDWEITQRNLMKKNKV